MLIDIEKTIREYLPDIIHMSLATCKDNTPWVCEVHYAYDQNLNLYFRSKEQTRHSKEIADNPPVSGSIIKQHNPSQKPRGVYFEGIAEMLSDVQEADPAYSEYCSRFGTDKSILAEAQRENGHQFYKITVKKFFVFDAQESSPSTKYELAWR